MGHKTVVCLSDNREVFDIMRTMSSSLDLSILMATPIHFDEALRSRQIELIIFDHMNYDEKVLNSVESLAAEKNACPILIISSPDQLDTLREPRHVTSDVIVSDATHAEYEFRMRRLLWPGEDIQSHEIINVADISINLATYQVTRNGEVINLTYLEYALLAFLASHPGRTYSREALLQRVWGFDYAGGTRTVDVHVRRIRSKIGERAAEYIETVRGVGYLFRRP